MNQIELINKQFDNQIKLDKSFEIDKQLFNLSINLSLEDWKKIRSDHYWYIHDNLKEKERKKFIIKCIQKYLYNK